MCGTFQFNQRGKTVVANEASPERSHLILASLSISAPFLACEGQANAINIRLMVSRYNHARELRTIGQQLAKQNIDIFELRYDDGEYVLVCGDPNPPFTDLIHLRYSSFELKSLEFRAIEARSSGFKLVEFTGLAEILRAIGRHVERLDAKLVSISAPDGALDGSILKIAYETRIGRNRNEDMVADDIAGLAMRMYKERAYINAGSREGRSAT